jgi:hypothetical protein
MSRQASNIDDELNHLATAVAHIPYTVKQAITCDDMCVVLTVPPAGTTLNRNVFCYLPSGEILWQIQESPHGTQIDKPYTSLHINDHKQLIAGNWNGVDYSVDLENGIVTAAAFDK